MNAHPITNNNLQSKSNSSSAPMYFLIVDNKSNVNNSNMYTILQQSNLLNSGNFNQTVVVQEDVNGESDRFKELGLNYEISKEVHTDTGEYIILSESEDSGDKNAALKEECVVVSDNEENADYVQYEMVNSEEYVVNNDQQVGDGYLQTENNVYLVGDESYATYYDETNAAVNSIEAEPDSSTALMRCSLCNSLQRGVENLKRHIIEDHTSMVSNYPCDTCTKTFTSDEALQKHKKTHSTLIFQCNLCPRKFSKQTHLKNHCTTFHRQNPHTCPYCHLAFTSMSDLKMHIASTQCGSSTSSNGLKRRDLEHEIKRSPKIVAVDKVMTEERVTEAASSLFRCNVCAKKYVTLEELKKHEKTHIGEQTFQCEFMQYISNKWDSGK